MSRSLAALRLVWLLALRDLLRAPRRSALLAAVVAVPVLALSAAATVLATTALSPTEQLRYSLGASDYLLSHRGEVADPPRLPSEVRRVTETDARGAILDMAGGRHPVDLRDLPAEDPLVRDVTQLLAGRYPARSGEVAVSPALLRDQSLEIGGVLALDRPASRYTVVGVARNPLNVQGRQVLLPPGTARQLDPALILERRHYVEGTDLQVKASRGDGVRAVSRSEATGVSAPVLPARDRAAAVALTLLATVIVCAAALGITARRHAREVAILAANGASKGHTSARLVFYTLPPAAVGAAAGAALGVGGAALTVPLARKLSGHVVGDLVVPAAAVAGVGVLANLSALAAALLCAAWAGRRPPRHTLAAPVSSTAGAVKAAWAGLALLAAGTAGASRPGPLGASALAGLVVGAALLAPLMLRLLSVAAGPLPLAWRAGLRDAARQADRTAPAVAALVVTITCAVAGASYLVTADAAQRAAYVPQLAVDQALVRNISSEGPVPPAAAEAIAAALPTRVLRPLLAAQAGRGEEAPLVYVGPQPGVNPLTNLYLGDLQTLSGAGGDAQRQAFLDGKVIALDEDLARQQFTTVWWSPSTGGDFTARQHSVATVPTPVTVAGPRALMAFTAADQLGLDSRQRGFILSLTRPPATAEVTRAEQALEAFPGLELVREVGYQSNVNRQVLVLVSAAMLFALLTALAVAALATQELSPFIDALQSIGASQAAVRLVAGLQAAATALTGALLGAAAGLLAASRLAPTHAALTVPWLALGLLVVVVPLLTALLAGLTTRRPNSVRQRMG